MLETTIIGGHAPRSPPRALNPRSSPGSVMHLVGNAPEGPALPDSARQPIDASLDGIGCRARPKCTHDPCDPDDDNARVLGRLQHCGVDKNRQPSNVLQDEVRLANRRRGSPNGERVNALLTTAFRERRRHDGSHRARRALHLELMARGGSAEEHDDGPRAARWPIMLHRAWEKAVLRPVAAAPPRPEWQATPRPPLAVLHR